MLAHTLYGLNGSRQMRVLLESEEPALRMTHADRISCETQSTNLHLAGSGQVSAGDLYRYLEMEPLFGAFARRLQSGVGIDALHFKNASLGQAYDGRYCDAGALVENRLDFNLEDNRGYLGSLTVLRHKQFLSADVRRVKASVDALLGPLRNATKYVCACRSAYIDTLTGLSNRAALDEAMSRSLAYNSSTSMMVCDVDRFKSINDNCGHKTGDTVLLQFAEILRSSIRKSDVVYRYGGDEFVVILADSTLACATESAERIRKSIEQTTLYIDNACINLTTTIGLTGLKPGESLDEAFLRADAALLAGKKSGKNKIVCR